MNVNNEYINQLKKVQELIAVKNISDAKILCSQLLNESPNNATSLFYLAYINFHEHDYALARQHVMKSLAEKNNDNALDCYILLADISQEEKSYDESLEYYKKVLETRPQLPRVLERLGQLYQSMGENEQARDTYIKCISIDKNAEIAHFRMGELSLENNDLDNAEKSFQHALRCVPNRVESLNYLGIINQKRAQYPKALTLFEKALQFDANNVDIVKNIAITYQLMDEIDKANEMVDTLIADNKKNPELIFFKALLCLVEGNFKDGWRYYEKRFQLPKVQQLFTKREENLQPIKRWDGKASLVNKRILILKEQGFGDYLQFIRFARNLKELGAYVVAECPEPMIQLIKTCPFIDELYTTHKGIDYYVYLLSLPGYFCLTVDNIPSETPYFHIYSARHDELKQSRNVNIGLCFSGSNEYSRNILRSVPLHYASALYDENIQFYLLQAEGYDETAPDTSPLINFAGLIHNFYDMAEIIQSLDLLLTVDTAAAHLAGALNVECWLLLSKGADWRWFLDRTDSPWYPSIKIYRQSLAGEWDDVFKRVKRDLLQRKKQS